MEQDGLRVNGVKQQERFRRLQIELGRARLVSSPWDLLQRPVCIVPPSDLDLDLDPDPPDLDPDRGLEVDVRRGAVEEEEDEGAYVIGVEYDASPRVVREEVGEASLFTFPPGDSSAVVSVTSQLGEQVVPDPDPFPGRSDNPDVISDDVFGAGDDEVSGDPRTAFRNSFTCFSPPNGRPAEGGGSNPRSPSPAKLSPIREESVSFPWPAGDEFGGAGWGDSGYGVASLDTRSPLMSPTSMMSSVTSPSLMTPSDGEEVGVVLEDTGDGGEREISSAADHTSLSGIGQGDGLILQGHAEEKLAGSVSGIARDVLESGVEESEVRSLESCDHEDDNVTGLSLKRKLDVSDSEASSDHTRDKKERISHTDDDDTTRPSFPDHAIWGSVSETACDVREASVSSTSVLTEDCLVNVEDNASGDFTEDVETARDLLCNQGDTIESSGFHARSQCREALGKDDNIHNVGEEESQFLQEANTGLVDMNYEQGHVEGNDTSLLQDTKSESGDRTPERQSQEATRSNMGNLSGSAVIASGQTIPGGQSHLHSSQYACNTDTSLLVSDQWRATLAAQHPSSTLSQAIFEDDNKSGWTDCSHVEHDLWDPSGRLPSSRQPVRNTDTQGGDTQPIRDRDTSGMCVNVGHVSVGEMLCDRTDWGQVPESVVSPPALPPSRLSQVQCGHDSEDQDTTKNRSATQSMEQNRNKVDDALSVLTYTDSTSADMETRRRTSDGDFSRDGSQTQEYIEHSDSAELTDFLMYDDRDLVSSAVCSIPSVDEGSDPQTDDNTPPDSSAADHMYGDPADHVSAADGPTADCGINQASTAQQDSGGLDRSVGETDSGVKTVQSAEVRTADQAPGIPEGTTAGSGSRHQSISHRQTVVVQKEGQSTCEDVPCEDVPCEDMLCEVVPCEGVPCEDVPHEDVPCDDAPCEDIPCEDVPCEGVPCEDVPHKDVPCEDVTYGNVPFEDVTPSLTSVLPVDTPSAASTTPVSVSGPGHCPKLEDSFPCTTYAGDSHRDDTTLHRVNTPAVSYTGEHGGDRRQLYSLGFGPPRNVEAIAAEDTNVSHEGDVEFEMLAPVSKHVLSVGAGVGTQNEMDKRQSVHPEPVPVDMEVVEKVVAEKDSKAAVRDGEKFSKEEEDPGEDRKTVQQDMAENSDTPQHTAAKHVDISCSVESKEVFTTVEDDLDANGNISRPSPTQNVNLLSDNEAKNVKFSKDRVAETISVVTEDRIISKQDVDDENNAFQDNDVNVPGKDMDNENNACKDGGVNISKEDTDTETYVRNDDITKIADSLTATMSANVTVSRTSTAGSPVIPIDRAEETTDTSTPGVVVSEDKTVCVAEPVPAPSSQTGGNCNHGNNLAGSNVRSKNGALNICREGDGGGVSVDACKAAFSSPGMNIWTDTPGMNTWTDTPGMNTWTDTPVRETAGANNMPLTPTTSTTPSHPLPTTPSPIITPQSTTSTTTTPTSPSTSTVSPQSTTTTTPTSPSTSTASPQSTTSTTTTTPTSPSTSTASPQSTTSTTTTTPTSPSTSTASPQSTTSTTTTTTTTSPCTSTATTTTPTTVPSLADPCRSSESGPLTSESGPTPSKTDPITTSTSQDGLATSRSDLIPSKRGSIASKGDPTHSRNVPTTITTTPPTRSKRDSTSRKVDPTTTTFTTTTNTTPSSKSGPTSTTPPTGSKSGSTSSKVDPTTTSTTTTSATTTTTATATTTTATTTTTTPSIRSKSGSTSSKFDTTATTTTTTTTAATTTTTIPGKGVSSKKVLLTSRSRQGQVNSISHLLHRWQAMDTGFKSPAPPHSPSPHPPGRGGSRFKPSSKHLSKSTPNLEESGGVLGREGEGGEIGGGVGGEEDFGSEEGSVSGGRKLWIHGSTGDLLTPGRREGEAGDQASLLNRAELDIVRERSRPGCEGKKRKTSLQSSVSSSLSSSSQTVSASLERDNYLMASLQNLNIVLITSDEVASKNDDDVGVTSQTSHTPSSTVTSARNSHVSNAAEGAPNVHSLIEKFSQREGEGEGGGSSLSPSLASARRRWSSTPRLFASPLSPPSSSSLRKISSPGVTSAGFLGAAVPSSETAAAETPEGRRSVSSHPPPQVHG